MNWDQIRCSLVTARVRSTYDGRLCFHRCVSVQLLRGGGLPHPKVCVGGGTHTSSGWWGVPQVWMVGDTQGTPHKGVPHPVMVEGGTPSSHGRGLPRVPPPSRLGRGYPGYPLDLRLGTLPPSQVWGVLLLKWNWRGTPVMVVGGTPSSQVGGYSIQSWWWVPHPVMVGGYPGYPLPSRPGWGVPWVPPNLGWCTLNTKTWNGVPPVQTWDGVPPRTGMEYPHPDLGWGTPHPYLGWGNPYPDLGWGTPHPDLGWSTLPSRPGMGYPPRPGMGYPPELGQGTPPHRW